MTAATAMIIHDAGGDSQYVVVPHPAGGFEIHKLAARPFRQISASSEATVADADRSPRLAPMPGPGEKIPPLLESMILPSARDLSDAVRIWSEAIVVAAAREEELERMTADDSAKRTAAIWRMLDEN